MISKTAIVIGMIWSCVFVSFVASEEPMLLRPILDETGNESGLYNVNPDPDAEPWISGGGRALTAEEDKCIPELMLPAQYQDRETNPLPSKVDNSLTRYFPPLFTQRGASCCQAAGISYIFSYEMCRIRDLDAQDPANIFPYGFTYNFINGGSTSSYSSFSDGWTAAGELGIPDLQSYGGQLEGTASQTSWVNGYGVYRRAMSNRYVESYRITCTSNDGIERMKQWLFDRADGSNPGGCIGFLAWTDQTRDVLPSSSPEAGHTYIKAFGTTGGHCMTLVGYNDDITYDLNGDGILSAQERGGFLMVNSYGERFGTNGRAYIPYSLFLNGSMKSSSVYSITVVEEAVEPLLTYRVTITHDRRSDIEIIRGYSTTTSATTPSRTYRYRECFSNGGALPMEGRGLSETIEMGLDVSEFIDAINGRRTKFFLQITSEGGSGKVDNFSVMDYTGPQVKEYKCSETNVAITTGTTTLWVLSDNEVNGRGIAIRRPREGRSFYVSPLTSGKAIHFKYSLSQTKRATFRVTTIHGQKVHERVVDLAGKRELVWDKTGNNGQKVSAGKYIARLELADGNAFYTPVHVFR
ncbi:MAG: hypothetical protein JW768_04885 [Chitinispirillaceae bacterium]|nr:hypothetical protein [Chitinispirillaceae bacterium]